MDGKKNIMCYNPRQGNKIRNNDFLKGIIGIRMPEENLKKNKNFIKFIKFSTE